MNSLVDVATSISKNCVESKSKDVLKKKSGLHIHIGIFPKRICKKADGVKKDLPELDRMKQILLVYSALEEKGLNFAKRKCDVKRMHEEEAKTKIGNDDFIIDSELTESLNDKILGTRCVRKLEVCSSDKSRSKRSVNLVALYKHGTIEFRGHGGTVNP